MHLKDVLEQSHVFSKLQVTLVKKISNSAKLNFQLWQEVCGSGRKYLDQIKKIYYNSKPLILLILFSNNQGTSLAFFKKCCLMIRLLQSSPSYLQVHMKFKFVSRRNLSCPFLKIEKIALILKTKALIVSIFEFFQIFHSKCSFKSIQEKKIPNFSLRALFFLCF